MKWITTLGITIFLLLIILYEWPKIGINHKKEKISLVTITVIGWLLSILLLFFPDMPGPTQMIEMLFKPLDKLLGK
ncbi:hypothetical protein [Ectobacillus polymachus]|uniref:hypothetical protein n=1 Tax=Ectobacillus polymachus TaxID=1508806 RepID=UPI003A85A5B1